MEAFDLALRLGVVGLPVLLDDAQPPKFVFEGVASLAKPSGVNQSVVGQGRRRQAIGRRVGAECGEDCCDSDGAEWRARQGQAGMVIDLANDLHVAAISQWPVGEIRLPALIGQLGLEANIGRFWALLWLRGNEAGVFQGPPDRCR